MRNNSSFCSVKSRNSYIRIFKLKIKATSNFTRSLHQSDSTECVFSDKGGKAEDRLKSMKNQESCGDLNDHHDAQKRKWPYSESSPTYSTDGGNYSDKSAVVAAKKCMTSYGAYENFQINPQFIISDCPSSGQEQVIESSDANVLTTMATTIASSSSAAAAIAIATVAEPTETSAAATATVATHCNQSTIQMLNTMELGENIEYVNILYEDDLLTSIQAPVATESHYINFEPNWGNADILDLDQRNYYYEVNNAATINLTNLNGQMTQHNEQDASSIHIHQHHHHQSPIGGQSETPQQQCLEVTEHTVNNHINGNNHHQHQQQQQNNPNNSNTNHHNHNSSNIHNITEYEVIHNVYPEAANGREKSTSNLRKLCECVCVRFCLQSDFRFLPSVRVLFLFNAVSCRLIENDFLIWLRFIRPWSEFRRWRSLSFISWSNISLCISCFLLWSTDSMISFLCGWKIEQLQEFESML